VIQKKKKKKESVVVRRRVVGEVDAQLIHKAHKPTPHNTGRQGEGPMITGTTVMMVVVLSLAGRGVRGFLSISKRALPTQQRLFATSATPSSAGTQAARGPIQFYYNDVFHVDMPEGHRFPMEKYSAFRRQAQQRLYSLPSVAFHPSPLASLADLETTHDPAYIQRYLTGRVTAQEKRESGFDWNDQHVNRTLSSVGGTVAATHAVLRQDTSRTPAPQVGAHLAGGTHHAFKAKMEGFCIFSDIAVAVNVALRDYPDEVRKVLIVDLDVHQGNGNAVLFQNDDRVYTFSMHCSENYFSNKQTSDHDVEVEPNTGDAGYLALLEQHLPLAFQNSNPDLVFFQAGVDPHISDRLGRLSLTRAGLQRRNLRVLQFVEAYKSKCVVVAGGGYPSDSDPSSGPYGDIINAHADVYVAAAEFFGGGSKMVPLLR